MKARTGLSQRFSHKKIIKYVIPTIVMMLFMSSYTIIDGIFVSRFVDEAALVTINVVYPILGTFLAIGFMMSSGSNAIIAKLLGSGNKEKARSFFSVIYITAMLISIILIVLILKYEQPILSFLGCDGKTFFYGKRYITPLVLFVPAIFLQQFAQVFFITNGKPNLGLIIVLIGGIFNIFFDYLFIVTLNFGIAGAAYATGIGFLIPGIFGILYFTFNKSGILYFVKPKFNFSLIINTLKNGSSEFINNMSLSIVTYLFNVILLRMSGESAVAAITVVLYIQIIQVAIYTGYSLGVSPIVSYKYGQNNRRQLRKVFKFSFIFISISSILVIVISYFGSSTGVSWFIRSDSESYLLSLRAFKLFLIAYLFMGFNIFASSMFTAFNNGRVSAILSFLRTLVFVILSLLTLPKIFGLTGVFISVPVAEAVSFLFSIMLYFKYKKKYLDEQVYLIDFSFKIKREEHNNKCLRNVAYEMWIKETDPPRKKLLVYI